METPLLSVIVPVYNVADYLSRCVDSILAQHVEAMEVILVNDGSRDSSGSLCDSYAEKDSRIRVLHKENGGLSSARNAGLDICRGEYVAFVDSDDWVEPDAYENMIRIARELDVKLVCGGRYDVSGKTGEKKVGLCPPKTEKISAEELVGRILTWDQCDSSACDKLFHRSLLENWRFPLGKVCEDVPVMYRIILQTDLAVMYSRPVYNYFHRPGSITNSSVSDKTFHFLQHTEVIYPYIRQHHPAITDQARYLRIRALAYSCLILDASDAASRVRYQDLYADCCAQLRSHFGFLLASPLFAPRERATNLLLAVGLYRPLRAIRHRNR